MKLMLRFRPTARGVLSLLTFCFFGFQVSSQNLVPNGSFEEGINCPTFIGNVSDECLDWYSSSLPNEVHDPSPDWFHECSEMEVLSPPNIAFGIQEVYDGEGYAGVVTYDASSEDYREIIGVELVQPLVIGQIYNVSFKFTSVLSNMLALETNNLGFHFSTHPTFQFAGGLLNESHFAIDTTITITNNWSSLSEEFIADSNYTYFHIGNFFNDSFTDINLNGLAGYYLIDDVQIITTLNIDTTKPSEVIFYPNPASNTLYVKVLDSKFNNGEIRIINSVGQEIRKATLSDFIDQYEFDISNLAQGTYTIYLMNPKFSIHEIFIKI